MSRVPRWLFPVALGGVLACVDAVLVEERPAAELAIEMQTDTASQAKVFFDTGSGFNEREAAACSILPDSKTHVLLFPLPAKTLRSIRFDPLEISGVVQIRRVTVQKPESHARLKELDPVKVSALNEIESMTHGPAGIEVRIVDGARDPQLLLPVTAPFRVRHSTRDFLTDRNLRIGAFFLALVLGAAAICYWWSWFARPIHAVDAVFQKWAAPTRDSLWLRLDGTAIWFYAACLLGFLLFSAGKFHGSSISIASATYRDWIDVEHAPLLGTPKKVRSDEASFHTPTILNQLYRRDTLSVNDSLIGPGKAALLGNIPCRHFTQLFRPQFWAFFVLPVDFAFSVYWQMKGLLLLTGTFALVLLLTRSSGVAAICALWYFFSAYTQWAYSWASLLPEMIGSFSWTIALTCYLTVGRNYWALVLAAIGCAVAALNFALCAYPPHQLPLVVLGLAIIAGWVWSRRNAIWQRDGRLIRLTCLSGAWLIVAAVMACFYLDAKETLLAAAGTVYPGQRSSSGGGISLAQFLSHFLDFWKSEDNYPPSQGNICEASGYLWLAPLTLLLARPPRGQRPFTVFLVCCWIAFLVLACWMVLPIPAEAARWVMFNRVQPFRCFHALGLINVIIVGLFLAEHVQSQRRLLPKPMAWLRGLAAGILLIVLLVRMNRTLDFFFPRTAIITAAAYCVLLIGLLVWARPKAFAAALLVPLLMTNGLVNPLDRGLEMITSSSLFKAAHGDHKAWLDHKWLIYAPWADQPTFLAATGIDVIDSLQIVPDLARFSVFDADGRYSQVTNRSSYVFAQPLPPGEPSSFLAPIVATVVWKVSPLDPKLKQIGVDRVAFAYQPPTPELNQSLVPLLEASFPGLQIYHLR